MELERNDEIQLNDEETAEKTVRDDRFVSDAEYLEYVDSDPEQFEEALYYDLESEAAVYSQFLKQGTNENSRLFEEPVLSMQTMSENDSESAEESASVSEPEIEPEPEKEPEPNLTDRQRTIAELEESIAQLKRSLRENSAGKSKLSKTGTWFSVRDKHKRILFVTLIVSAVLIAGLIAGFILAYHFSNSKTYVIKRDKTPPVVTLSDKTIYGEDQLEASDFIDSIDDETEVRFELEAPIDYTKNGEQTVSILFTDEAGNTTVETAKLTIIHDTEGPSILCEPLIRVTTGQSVAYKSFITVTDDYDEDPSVEVDNSNVDLSKKGVYKLKYTATDKSGNKTVKKCRVAVTESKGDVEEDEVFALVDSTLSGIVDDSMDDIHKVWAVYEYVRHIPYVASNYSYNYMYEGYRILHDNKGDCYGSFAASKLLLDRLGYKCIPMETDRNGHHYWNMVSIDNGETWYHFDATAWQQWGTELPVMCMISSNALEKISELHFGTHRYNAKDYPSTPKKSMPVPDDIPEIYGDDY